MRFLDLFRGLAHCAFQGQLAQLSDHGLLKLLWVSLWWCISQSLCECLSKLHSACPERCDLLVISLGSDMTEHSILGLCHDVSQSLDDLAISCVSNCLLVDPNALPVWFVEANQVVSGEVLFGGTLFELRCCINLPTLHVSFRGDFLIASFFDDLKMFDVASCWSLTFFIIALILSLPNPSSVLSSGFFAYCQL